MRLLNSVLLILWPLISIFLLMPVGTYPSFDDDTMRRGPLSLNDDVFCGFYTVQDFRISVLHGTMSSWEAN